MSSSQVGTSDNRQSTLQDPSLVQPVSQMANYNGDGHTDVPQLDFNAMNSDGSHAQPYPPMHYNPEQGSNLLSITDVPFQTGCAPAMIGFEGDFGDFDGLESIDFSAFDAVFGDSSWEFSSTTTDWSMDGMNS